MTVLGALRERVTNHAVELVRRAADVTVQRTQEAMSRRTGATAAGVSHSEPVAGDTYVSCEIVSAEPSSKFQDEGTGIYGPTGMRIFPTHAKALRFDWPAAGGVVFFASVAGSRGKHFWREPMPQRWHDALAESAGPP